MASKIIRDRRLFFQSMAHWPRDFLPEVARICMFRSGGEGDGTITAAPQIIETDK